MIDCRYFVLFLSMVGVVCGYTQVEEPIYRVQKHEPIKSRLTPATLVEQRRIRQWIDDLQSIDSFDFGYSPTINGLGFAPISGSFKSSSRLVTNHNLKQSKAVLELVKLGPKALPFLLNGLNDTRSTNRPVPADSGSHTDGEGRYTLRVGDICATIIGQIVGKPYTPVVYIPSGQIGVTRYAGNQELIQPILETWQSADSGQKLLDALLEDFYTVPHSRSAWDKNYWVRMMPPKAAMRMLYYYPEETAALIAKRFDELDVKSSNHTEREFANRLSTREFLELSAWCRHPKIVAVMESVTRRTTIPIFLIAASDSSAFAEQRIRDFIEKLPLIEESAQANGYHLLVAYGVRFPDSSKAIFENYLNGAGIQRKRTMCLVLKEVRSELIPQLLLPMLSDRHEFKGWLHPYDSESPEIIRYPIRLCDLAAMVIAESFPEVEFTLRGNYRELNLQIYRIKEQMREKLR